MFFQEHKSHRLSSALELLIILILQYILFITIINRGFIFSWKAIYWFSQTNKTFGQTRKTKFVPKFDNNVIWLAGLYLQLVYNVWRVLQNCNTCIFCLFQRFFRTERYIVRYLKQISEKGWHSQSLVFKKLKIGTIGSIIFLKKFSWNSARAINIYYYSCKIICKII